MIFKITIRAIPLLLILLLYPSFSVKAEASSIDPMLLLDSGEMLEYALELEALTLNHSLSSYSYRSAGSPGAEAAANWITDKLKSFGLEVKVEKFNFLTWELYDKPSLTLYVDSQPIRLETFTPFHLSWPTPEKGLKGNLVVYDYREEAMQMKGRILVIEVDELILNRGVGNLFESIRSGKPRAILYTYAHPSNMWMPSILNSGEGKEFWDIKAPAGWIEYKDWKKIKEALEHKGIVQVEMKIPAKISYGFHKNIVGELSEAKDARALLLTAHYDTVMSPGFIDDGSGVASVLAIAHAFTEAYKRGYTLPYKMKFVFFTAEEFGLIGSLHYRAYHKTELSQTVGVINLDSIGGHRLKITESSSLLDEIAIEAAYELAIPLTRGMGVLKVKPSPYINSEFISNSSSLEGNQGYETGADHLPFEDPKVALQIAQRRWKNLQLSINEDVNIPAITITSRPIFPYYLRTGEEPGWIHTPFDNSTTPGWVDKKRLKGHIEVVMLTISKTFQATLKNGNLNLNVQGSPKLELKEERKESEASSRKAITTGEAPTSKLKQLNLRISFTQTIILALILITISVTISLLPRTKLTRRGNGRLPPL